MEEPARKSSRPDERSCRRHPSSAPAPICMYIESARTCTPHHNRASLQSQTLAHSRTDPPACACCNSVRIEHSRAFWDM
jgi:hypothetical protein